VDLDAFLTSEDEAARRIARGLDWIQRTIGADVVDARVAAQQQLRGTKLVEMFDTISPGARADLLGWHLYNCQAYLLDPPSYDTNAGCRIVPTIVALGARVDILEHIPAAADRLREVASGRADIEKTLFELLVAARYGEAGWRPEFLEPTGVAKTPDIRATVEGREVYIECKRLSKSSGYAQAERDHWMRLVKPVGEYLQRTPLPILLDIVFHKELSTLPETFLVDTIVPKLTLALPGTIIDSDTMTVTLRPVDLGPMQTELERVNLKTNGTRFNYLLFGEYDPARGYHSLFLGDLDECHPLFVKKVTFASGLVWSCDAPRALARKARDTRNRVWDAIDQLPRDADGIVHVAVESYDGPVVEWIRNAKINKALSALRDRKQLRFVHIHLLSFESPPDEAWAVEESVFSTSFAPGAGATAREHEESPYRLKRHHVWSFDETVTRYSPFRGFEASGGV
jgi:hypothetical protein